MPPLKCKLHGLPANPDIVTPAEITEFFMWLEVKVRASIVRGHTTAPDIQDHDLVYSFKYHDGEFYHYQFVKVKEPPPNATVP